MFAVDKPFLMPRWGDPSVSFFFKVLPDSFSFFLIDIAAVLAFQFDKFVLLHYGGPGQVARFEVATRPFLLASMSLGLLLTPLWPAIGEAVHRGDPRWAKKVVLKVAYSSAALMAVLALVMVAAGGLIVRLWTGRTDVTPGALLFGMIGAYFVVKAWTDTQTVVLYGLGGQRRMLWVALIHGATTLVLSLVLGRLYGIYGVASASLLGFLLTASWYVTLQTKRTLDSLDSTKCLGESVLT
jgi:O-antigen/teichoic acid export membrane protein